MNENERCEEEVHVMNSYTAPCPYPAKHRIVDGTGGEMNVCGVHRRALLTRGWRDPR